MPTEETSTKTPLEEAEELIQNIIGKKFENIGKVIDARVYEKDGCIFYDIETHERTHRFKEKDFDDGQYFVKYFNFIGTQLTEGGNTKETIDISTRNFERSIKLLPDRIISYHDKPYQVPPEGDQHFLKKFLEEINNENFYYND